MEKIIICEGFSSGINYVKDIRDLGYEPIILETYLPDHAEEIQVRLSDYAQYKGEMPQIIRATNNYDETLELVSKFNPLALVIGQETGVDLGTKIAHDLGLPGNDKNLLPQMTQKMEMQNALKRAGLRYIKGDIISSLEEALNFWEEINQKDVVIKPDIGAASDNVYVCKNIDEIKNACNIIFNANDLYGELITKAVIQECIVGEEYVVDTMSRDGKKYVSLMWKYNKIPLPGGAKIYDSMHSINEYEIYGQTKQLIEYANKVVDAIGIKYGPVHAEFMIDEKGPVLIEVNCRICGGNLPGHYLDKVFGHHETNLHLEALLDEEAFNSRCDAGYTTTGKGYVKFIVVPYDCIVDDATVLNLLKNYSSFSDTFGIFANKKEKLYRTIDLGTNGGKIYMVSENPSVVFREATNLHDLEQQDFNNIFHVVEKF